MWFLFQSHQILSNIELHISSDRWSMLSAPAPHSHSRFVFLLADFSQLLLFSLFSGSKGTNAFSSFFLLRLRHFPWSYPLFTVVATGLICNILQVPTCKILCVPTCNVLEITACKVLWVPSSSKRLLNPGGYCLLREPWASCD